MSPAQRAFFRGFQAVSLFPSHYCDNYAAVIDPARADGEWLHAYWLRQFGFSRADAMKGIVPSNSAFGDPMTQIRAILSDLQDTDLTLERLLTLAHSTPDDEIALFNAETVKKRRKDLERRLNYELRHEQADVVEYKIERVAIGNYPAKAIASSILTFQELVTSVFDAIRTTPKKTYKPSPASVELSAMDFAGARAGSVVVAMSVQNERLLAVKSEARRHIRFGDLAATRAKRH